MSAVDERAVRAPEPGAVLDEGAVLVSDHDDPAPRWSPGERLHHVFEATCDRLAAEGDPDRPAVSRGDLRVGYAELDARANRLARFLRGCGVPPGGRVALLVDDPVLAYTALLAVLKLHAAYLPLDPGTPADRVAFIVDDADVRTVLTLSHLRDRARGCGAEVVVLDDVRDAVDRLPSARLPAPPPVPADELAYVIYTSGTTGRPKGVPIEQASIVNFVRVAAEVYGVRPDDRMYQGLTLAFDFSVEEIWVAWAVGAALVPRPGRALVGDELAEFLREEGVSALCCVPTLLATVPDDLPELRFLLVSGEACPQDLVTRWHRPGRRFLNTYGPTEATVTATWTTVDPDRPVTIGVPLPTYSVVVLAEDSDEVLPRGATGEIGIAGVALSPGYLNRPEATAKAFVPDVAGARDNPSGRIYRTGDLGRITDGLRVEYLGRIDTQVKIRGYRIELTEIESLMLRLPGVAQAVVDTHRPSAGVVELVAYYTERTGGGVDGGVDTAVDEDAVLAALHERLPAYMVPAYLQRLDRMPMLPSDKADRKNLPAPSGPRRGRSTGEAVAPQGPVEEAIAAAVADQLGLERVSATADLFDELGMSSLLVAQLSARLRTDPALPPIGTKDLYLNPTVRGLATALDGVAARGETATRPIAIAPRWQHLLCGVAQGVVLLLGVAFAALLPLVGYPVLAASSGVLDGYLRAVAVAVGTFAALSLLPAALKWLLVGRAVPQTYRIWGLRYLRHWAAGAAMRASPMGLLVGSPLYVVYARLLGARIGRGAAVFAPLPLAHADLVTIGEDAVVRRDAVLLSYRAESGRIRTGRISVGRGAIVGEAAVLDIDTALGDGAQIGHASALLSGQVVAPGSRVHGSPAQETTTDFTGVAPLPAGRRRIGYGAFQLLVLALLSGPAVVLALYAAIPAVYQLISADHAPPATAFTSPGFYLAFLAASALLVVGAMMVRLVVVLAGSRLLHRTVRAGTPYPLYGLRWACHRAIGRMSNSRLFNDLLGDSSYIVGFLRALGYDLRPVEQTGSNFGLAVKHDSPGHTGVGTGTLVSDGLSVANAEYSASSFVVRPVAVGRRNFVGNNVVVPAGSRAGDNVLLATKVMVPIDGPLRADTGLLGSPAFEIPRSTRPAVEDPGADLAADRATRLPRKNRSNLATIGAFVLQRVLLVYGAVLIALAALSFLTHLGPPAVGVVVLAVALFALLFSILVERSAMAFRRLRPRSCSIYAPYYWRHERLWKLSRISLLALFDGTPFKPLLWRLAGVRMGRRVFDDGAIIPEKSLVTIRDHATLNRGVIIQCHSLEDASFTSDTAEIGAGATLGPHAFVHYGTRIGDRVVVDADSFVMKGSQAAPDSHWRGNPAVEVADPVQDAEGGSARVIALPRSVPAPRVRVAIAALAASVAGLVAIGQVVLAALRLPATTAEAALVDGAFAAVRDLAAPATGAGDWAARLQLAGYARLTGAFDRHADVLTGARELAVLAVAGTIAALLVAARRRPVALAAIAVVLGVGALLPPVVAVATSVDPVPLGALWLAVGAVLMTFRGVLPLATAAVAVTLGVVTAPVLAVLPVLLVVVLLIRKRLARAAVAWPHVRPALARRAFGLGVAAWIAVLVTTVDPRPYPAEPSHQTLAEWLGTATDPRTGVAVPAGLWSELVRDGVPADRLTADGALVVGAPVTGTELARFGLLAVGSRDDLGDASSTDARAGAQLAANPRVVASPEVRDVLRSGSVDLRALAVLAGLAGRGPVAVAAVPALLGESAQLARHVVVLAPVDAATEEWLRAQRPPFAPSITTAPTGTTLSWPVPGPAGPLG